MISRRASPLALQACLEPHGRCVNLRRARARAGAMGLSTGAGRPPPPRELPGARTDRSGAVSNKSGQGLATIRLRAFALQRRACVSLKFRHQRGASAASCAWFSSQSARLSKASASG